MVDTKTTNTDPLSTVVDWGGPNVTFAFETETTQIHVAVDAGSAELLIAHLMWAVREVRAFEAWTEAGHDAWSYLGKGKPGAGNPIAEALARLDLYEDTAPDDSMRRVPALTRDLRDILGGA